MQVRYVVTGLAVVIGLAGCQRTSYDYSSNSNAGPGYTPPLQAQPVPSVQSGALPPPGGSSQFPTAPTATPPGSATVAAGAPTTETICDGEQLLRHRSAQRAITSMCTLDDLRRTCQRPAGVRAMVRVKFKCGGSPSFVSIDPTVFYSC